MISKETKTFTIDGKEMRFNRDAFNQAILLYSRQHHMKIGKVEQDMAEKIFVNIEALRNWRKGSNGPGSDSYIKDAASFLGVSDWTTLFTETDGGKEMMKLSERQNESVKKIYDACVEAINHFLYLENVRSMIRRKTADPELSASDMAYEISYRMFLVVDQEYFYLRNHEIYDSLAEFTTDLSSEVLEMLESYISEPDRVEELFDRCSIPAAQAMGQLNEIINAYVPEGV